MKRTALKIAAFAFLAAASATSAQAQRMYSVGVSAGAAMPTGDFGEVSSVGYNVTGSVGLSMPALPVSFRVDAMLNQFSFKEIDDLGTRVLGANANLVYAFPGVAIRPYVIGGAGMYNLKATGDNIESESQTNFGLNGGLGAQFALAGFKTFAEARYHHVMSKDDETGAPNMQFSPISFGISGARAPGGRCGWPTAPRRVT